MRHAPSPSISRTFHLHRLRARVCDPMLWLGFLLRQEGELTGVFSPFLSRTSLAQTPWLARASQFPREPGTQQLCPWRPPTHLCPHTTLPGTQACSTWALLIFWTDHSLLLEAAVCPVWCLAASLAFAHQVLEACCPLPAVTTQNRLQTLKMTLGRGWARESLGYKAGLTVGGVVVAGTGC